VITVRIYVGTLNSWVHTTT